MITLQKNCHPKKSKAKPMKMGWASTAMRTACPLELEYSVHAWAWRLTEVDPQVNVFCLKWKCDVAKR